MKNTKLFVLASVIIIAGVAFAIYKIKFQPFQKQASNTGNQKLITNIENNMKITSPVLENNGNIPRKYTCDDAGINPPLEFSDVPADAKSLALIFHDPDAPVAGGFAHWVIFNIDPAASGIKENSAPASGAEGTNSSSKTGYTSPCPPSGIHHYQFKLYALDKTLDLNSSAKREDVEKAMKGHILNEAMLVGLYQRQ